MTNYYGYWRMLAAAAVVAAFAYGCGGQAAVDHGGSLKSDEGQIAFMRATSFDGPDIESEVYTINVDVSAAEVVLAGLRLYWAGASSSFGPPRPYSKDDSV